MESQRKWVLSRFWSNRWKGLHTSGCLEWVKFNLDTGAAQAAVLKDWVKDKVTVTGASEVIFKTASGELVLSEGTGTFEEFGESGMRCRVRGALPMCKSPWCQYSTQVLGVWSDSCA